MKLKTTCDECGRVKELRCSYTIGVGPTSTSYKVLRTYKTYKCGHTEILDRDIETEARDFGSLNGKKAAYEYQREGIKFACERNANVLIADSMGLGKTVQALLTVRHRKDLVPCLVIVKSATTFQWIRECHEWLFNDTLSCYPIIGTQSFIPPGFKVYVISMDTLGRDGTWKKLLHLGLKLVIVDECHSFKDPGSARTKALINLIQTGNIKHKILLSGTPIKNRAAEYFTTLNLLAPDYFPSEASFKRRWLQPETTPSGVTVYKRLNPYRIKQFKELTANFIIRREKQEVLLDLPSFTRNFQFVTIEDDAVKNSYNKQLDLLSNLVNSSEGVDNFSLLGALARLRRITGLAKISLACDYAREFLESCDDYKLAIGVHHTDVLDTIALAMEEFNSLKLSGADSAIRKDQIVQEFKKPHRRVLVLNELAGGVGLNLQMCANCLVIERQWNAADEEQFESRFHRNGQTLPVVADYLIAQGTLDEWFHQMVEEKRQIFGETISNNWEFSSDGNAIRELAEKSISHRL